MDNKKLLTSIIFLAIGLSIIACTANEPSIQTDTNSHENQDLKNHIGCQEGEIDEEGNCLPAEENNAQLFGQDLEPYVQTQELNGEVKGFLARPKEEGQYPGVIMIHEWWGLNENIKEMAQILAKEGYIVLAVDLYNGEVAEDSAQARALATSVRENPEEAIKTMQAATEYLRNQGATNIGSVGWCFGGQQSLQISLNEKIDATVIYYGHLTDDTEELKKLNGPVLGIFGAEDSSIPVSSVNSFENQLDTIGLENHIYIYPKVGHAFANPSGSGYAAEETQDAWSKTVEFLDANLQ